VGGAFTWLRRCLLPTTLIGLPRSSNAPHCHSERTEDCFFLTAWDIRNFASESAWYGVRRLAAAFQSLVVHKDGDGLEFGRCGEGD
jgi:hypothetical protein